MDLRNCRECGRLFNYISGPRICPDCADALEKKFVLVKEYIYEHNGVGLQEVADAMEVSVAQIKQWVKEERLIFTSGVDAILECEKCGAPIVTGRYCNVCKDKMQKKLSSVIESQPVVEKTNKAVREKERMRFLDR